MDTFNYDPVIFLRCHSKTDEEYGDVRTEVWQALFEPSRNSHIVATCGGNKICLIDFETGDIEQRYSADNREIFYALTWNHGFLLDNKKCNILVAGGVLNTLYFICPSKKKQITYFSIPKKVKCEYILSLLFHPKEKQILFCAVLTGDINILKIHLSLESVSSFEIEAKIDSHFEITRIALCNYSNMLFSATVCGLYGWSLKSEIKKEWNSKMIEFCLPKNPNNPESKNNIVDSIEVMKNGFIASKCVLHGVIYIWHIRNVEISNNSKLITVNVIPNYILNWCLTENYYLEINTNYDVGLLSCGDEKGSIWLYDISCLKDTDYPPSESKIINPIQIIEWPIVNDVHLIKSRKLNLEDNDIIITKASIHKSGRHLVVITNRNTVCLWSKDSAS